MQIRRFSPDHKTKVPGGHPGLYAVPIQVDRAGRTPDMLEDFARRVNGMPLLVDNELHVAALYLEPHATMDEHSADHPMLFLVTSGQGSVRIGGSAGETLAIQAGDAMIWPAHLDHMVWTDQETLQAIVVEEPPERLPTER